MHGLKVLEAAVARYLAQHERYPVVTFDHVDPEATGLGDPSSPLLRLGRRDDEESPTLRTVLALDDAGLEVLQRGLSQARLQATEVRAMLVMGVDGPLSRPRLKLAA